mgnify:FL=1
MKINHTIFKAYDIRGIVGKELNNDIMYSIGIVFGQQVLEKKIKTCVIGRDGRKSGELFSKYFSDGLRFVGIDVIDIGVVPTPVVYYATHYFDTGTGVVVTGSHNPADYNGLKLMLAGETLWGDSILKIQSDLTNLHHQDKNLKFEKVGRKKQVDFFSHYEKAIIDSVNLKRPLKIGIDAGNGVAGPASKRLFKKLGCEVFDLYCDIDGEFPNHHPDPAEPSNLSDLIDLVINNKLDLGLAFDGDGDRLGVVTNSGQIIWPDRQLMLHAKEVLDSKPGSKIIFDVKCSRHVPQWISQHGGEPLMWKTGHSLIKAKLREINAPLAGEMSGHLFFNDRWPGFDDALYAGARLLEILSREKQPSKLLESLPESISTPELKLLCNKISHFDLVERLKSEGYFPSSTECNQIDGIRVEYIDGFGLARPSNTTPLVVLRFEAKDHVALAKIQEEFRKSLLSIDKSLELPF